MRENLQLKTLNDEGYFTGYASIFNVVDNQGDKILHGAFRDTLRDEGTGIKLLWQHAMSEPIGIFTLLREDARGLYVEGRLLLDVQRAKEAYSLLKAGAIAGLSIGYVPVEYYREPQTGVRVLEKVRLYEISLVTFPANAQATVQAVKSDWGVEIRTGEFIRLSNALDYAIHALRFP